MVATFPLIGERERDYALRYISRTPLDGRYEVVIRRATRNKKQNAFLHSVLTDIAEQLVWPPPPANDGQFFDLETWKRRCTLSWLIEERSGAEVITDLYGDKFGIFVPHTSQLSVDDMSSLCEWITAFAVGNGVVLEATKEQPTGSDEDYEAYTR